MKQCIDIIPASEDNYMYVVRIREGACVVDPCDAHRVLDICTKNDLKISYILLTHYHGDHTAGVSLLKKKTGAPVIASAVEAPSYVDMPFKDSMELTIGAFHITVRETPGHTRADISYYMTHASQNSQGAVFTGDTLFVGGCGRVFTGDYASMFASLKKLAALPAETLVYCGHEYTVENYEFACSLDPQNKKIQEYLSRAREKIRKGIPTMPSTITDECAVNPFMRAATSTDFMSLRKKKDLF